MNFSRMGQPEDIDKNHYRTKLKSFKEEASIKTGIAELKWLGYDDTFVRFSIKNLCEKAIPFSPDKIKIIDTDDNVLECKYIDSPPKGWISNLGEFNVYDNMLVKFIFTVPGMDGSTIIKRFIWTQQFYIGGGWREDYSIFDFILNLDDY